MEQRHQTNTFKHESEWLPVSPCRSSDKSDLFFCHWKSVESSCSIKGGGKTITKMTTAFTVRPFSGITVEVQICCWTRKYHPLGCFHWPSFLLRSLLHFASAVCALFFFSTQNLTVISPPWNQFPMQALGRTVRSIPWDRFASPLFKASECLYTVCNWTQYVCAF